MLNFGLNVLLVILLSVHVFFAFKGFRDSKVQLMHLLRQGALIIFLDIQRRYFICF
mgnify:CR=1